MRRYLLALAVALPTAAQAETWALGDCLTQSGLNIKYALHDGDGYITYNGSTPAQIFSKRDGDIGIITHIGNSGNMVMAVNLNTGRGYLITKRDDGKTIETNVSCKLSVTNR